ncbi:MAG: diacylglycerol kinase family lipid kinase [Clostridiaceae bacterium]|nr:diacylglycerol kinase family lipid kinase [Clostridiaceae bacterium]
MKDIMVIINPKAGNESSRTIKKQLVSHLKNYFDNIQLKITKKAGDAELFAIQAAQNEYEAICSVGGDGTVNEIFHGIVGQSHRPKVMIIPSGTGNLMARVLKISAIRTWAIKSFEFNKTKLIDIGLCNDRVFNLFASIGPIPDAMHEVTSEEKKWFGLLAYLKNSMANLATSEEYDLDIQTNNGNYQGKVDHLVISITNKLGSLVFTKENQSLSNGKANLFILKDSNFIPRLATLSSALSGRVEQSGQIEHCIASNISIASLDQQEIFVDLDGEKGPALPVKIQILKQQIEVYLPKTYKD